MASGDSIKPRNLQSVLMYSTQNTDIDKTPPSTAMDVEVKRNIYFNVHILDMISMSCVQCIT